MNIRRTIICLSLTLPLLATAQSKSELQASLTAATARGDSLLAANQNYMKLLDSLQVMTGVQVHNLDTVKNVLATRQAARSACMDSLASKTALASKRTLEVDSLSKEVARLRADNTALTDRLAATAAGQATGSGTMSAADQMMKLNGMMEQGLITKEEFLRMKGEIMK
jgi:hypothetical protein